MAQSGEALPAVSKIHDVIVVGAGITGAATAYHLRQAAGANVLLVDRHGPAAGGTGKSAAIIRQHYSTPLAVRLAKQSIAMFAAMPDELGASGGFVQCGYRMLVPADLLDGARTNIAMQQAQGVVTELIDGAKGAAALDWLNPDGVAAIVYEPAGGHADPVRATEAYVEAFRRGGGEVAFKTPARGLLGDAHGITGILTDDGPIEAGAVVNAAGPWAAPLAASAGLDIPLRSIREQDTVWEARAGRPLPDTPISNAVDAIYLRPLGDRRYVIGRGFPKAYEDVDPYNYKETVDEAFVAEIMERMEHRFPPLQGARRIDAYAALYDVTPDWYPFVGARDGVGGYFDACGGSGHGFKLGPAIGAELAQWVATGEVAEDFRQLSYDRIAAGNLFVQAYGGNRG